MHTQLTIRASRLQAGDWKELLEVVRKESFKGSHLQRYKGLGEMNPEQLWDTTMDPDKRIMLQVKIEDEEKADDIFTTLMGDKVEPRREFHPESRHGSIRSGYLITNAILYARDR